MEEKCYYHVQSIEHPLGKTINRKDMILYAKEQLKINKSVHGLDKELQISDLDNEKNAWEYLINVGVGVKTICDHDFDKYMVDEYRKLGTKVETLKERVKKETERIKKTNILLNELEEATSDPHRSMSKSGKNIWTIIQELREELLKMPIDDEWKERHRRK